MYDHSRQYRCTIIRGKAKSEMDDLLPVYALVVNEVCPCRAEEFERRFNAAFTRFLPHAAGNLKKTLDNHRTEVCGKLFGMYYFATDGMVYESERTAKFRADNDQPAFFKDICNKMQFPNGMQKLKTVSERVEAGICVRPNAFLLRLLLLAEEAHIALTKNDLGYYVLNALDVLRGEASPEEVLDAIREDRKNGIERRISVPGKANSYNYQHINEQLNYLELANLIRFSEGKRVVLNPKEAAVIGLIADTWNKKPDFDVYRYDLSKAREREAFQLDWDEYYSRLSPVAEEFETSVDALVAAPEADAQPEHTELGRERPEYAHGHGGDKTLLGDEGEMLVYDYERRRVAAYDPRLVERVQAVGKIRGLGYDIRSVVAEPGPRGEADKYIEVKSTKRVTAPDRLDPSWVDTLNLTRNEFNAAGRYGADYSIYRVYFTSQGATVFIISDVAKKIEEKKAQATAMTYRLDFSSACVDDAIKP